MEHEHAAIEQRMQMNYVNNDNQALKATAETYKLQLQDANREIVLLNKTGKDDSDQLAKLAAEYHQFRQDNLHQDTQIRNLTAEWREVSQ